MLDSNTVLKYLEKMNIYYTFLFSLRYPPGYFSQSYNFDFTNYAGIHRPVYIYTTPQTYIEDILITTNINGANG